MENENSSFTFWANMKEAIEVYKDEKFKYRLYDAITEYGLYGVWPEEDGSIETQAIISFVQAIAPSLDKSRGYYEKMAEIGGKGGRKPKIADEQIKNATIEVTKRLRRVPTRGEIVEEISRLYGVNVDVRTISRKMNEQEKRLILAEVLKEKVDKIPFDF